MTLAVVVLFNACSAHSPVRQHDGGVRVGSIDARDALDAALGRPGSPGSVQAACTPNATPGSEFYAACPDAGPRTASIADAGIVTAKGASDSGQLTVPPRDAGFVDASLPDPDIGPCAFLSHKDCQQSYFETDPSSIACSITGDTLHVSARACETCGVAGYLDNFGVMIAFCDRCTALRLDQPAVPQYPLNPHVCTSFQVDGDLSALNPGSDPCLDIYTQVGTSGSDRVNDGIRTVRACRCDRTTKKCLLCQNGACSSRP